MPHYRYRGSMANKGIQFERKVKQYFLDQGCNAIRSSASSSPVDVYVWTPSGDEYWIQAKSHHHGMGPYEWNCFLAFCRFFGKVPILATRRRKRRAYQMVFFEVEDYKTGKGEKQPMREVKL